MRKINLPSLRGVIGNWSYFSTIMKIKDIVEDNRIITVAESEELYSENINHILQREINLKRIEKIKDYLLNNNDHFFSSIIVAIHNGNPVWSDFDIEHHFRIENEVVDDEELNFIENKVGILTLSGDEEIFALDGQHRLIGLRAAYAENNDIGNEEVSLIYVVHNNNLKEKTRRLFTVLNKYAEKPKEAELIILDEDDAAAIITRRLVETHSILKLTNAVSDSNSANIGANDLVSFTTLVTINRINKEILKPYNIDYTKRPSDEVLEGYSRDIFNFWNYFFSNFSQIQRCINEEFVYFENGEKYNRNNETGGSLFLRPVGQVLFVKIYMMFLASGELEILSRKLSLIDFNLNGPNCKYIFWNNRILAKNDALKRNIFLYILGKYNGNVDRLQEEIRNIYETYGIVYNNHIQPIND